MRCADTSLINVPCPTNWVKNELGICTPIIRVPTTPTTPTSPGTQFTLPQLDLPGLYKPRSFGSISSMTIDHFVFDDAAVPSGHEAELDHLVALLNIYSEVQVHVEGNADSTGEAGYNVGFETELK
jgi:outer membrane protein OmpA-like peptidoglycan-associated protein